MIVIPMAGLSSRFFKAGYEKPKYMLTAHGRTLFDFAVLSFAQYFKTEKFLFIVRQDFDTPQFVYESCQKLGIKNYEVYVLEHETRGQAETVYLAVKELAQQQDLTIFNIDTFRFGFIQPDWLAQCDGYLEVFKGEGDNWSYAKAQNEESNKVIETAEKNPISDLCSTGLYYFSDANDFIDAFEKEQEKGEAGWQKGELYIAPLYNYMIQQGKEIRYNLIARDEVIFCGVPQEYMDFKNLIDIPV